MQGTCTIEPLEANQLLVRLRGVLVDDAIHELSADLFPRLRELGAGGQLIIDMHELESCTTQARIGLIELQQGIARLGARTAFVAHRPRFRGIGLYVAHKSGDPNARAFHFLSEAQTWLRSGEGRVGSHIGYFERARQSPRGSSRPRRSSDELRIRLKKLRDSSNDEEQQP
jgi:hypothetical protein